MKKTPSKKPEKARRELVTSAAPPRIQNILATTDFSDAAQEGVHYAVALAQKLKAAVTFLHVVEPPSRLAGLDAVILARADSDVLARVRQQLATLAKSETAGATSSGSTVRSGKPFHEITTAARECAADLIVIATHGHTGIEHALLGSTAERVVRHAPCPVLTVPVRITPHRARKTDPFHLKKILVPIDFSNLSKEALPYAVYLAGMYHAELVLLHFLEKRPSNYLLGGELMNQMSVPMIKQAEADLEHISVNLGKTTGLKSTIAVGEGKPFEGICAAAKTDGADLIILTTHGYTGLKHVWLGSTAERVVRHAPCPVLVVRELDHDFISLKPSPTKPLR